MTEALRSPFQQRGMTPPPPVSCLRRSLAETDENALKDSSLPLFAEDSDSDHWALNAVQACGSLLIIDSLETNRSSALCLSVCSQRPSWTPGWPQLSWDGRRIQILG